jgi:hypothetical protein
MNKLRELHKDVYSEIEDECVSQIKKWGIQNHPVKREEDNFLFRLLSENSREMCNFRASNKTLT